MFILSQVDNVPLNVGLNNVNLKYTVRILLFYNIYV